MHISIPCQIGPKNSLIEIKCRSLDMTISAASMDAALLALELKLTKILEVNIELSVEQISDNRYLLISNYGEFLRDMVFDLDPEITTYGQERTKRVKDAHLKSTN